MVRMHLASKRVMSEYKLNDKALDWLLGEVETRFFLAQVGGRRGSIDLTFKGLTAGRLRAAMKAVSLAPVSVCCVTKCGRPWL